MTDSNSTIHLLSIEDDMDYERLVGAWLEQIAFMKIQVTPAERLSDAALHHELDGYDCLLLDLGSPESLGIETLVSAREITTELPIVVLTSAGDYDVAEQSMRAGADRFLVKGDFGPEVLVETIVAAVDARSFIEPPSVRADLRNGAIPMSARIAGEMSGRLACSQSWNRYRSASRMQF